MRPQGRELHPIAGSCGARMRSLVEAFPAVETRRPTRRIGATDGGCQAHPSPSSRLRHLACLQAGPTTSASSPPLDAWYWGHLVQRTQRQHRHDQGAVDVVHGEPWTNRLPRNPMRPDAANFCSTFTTPAGATRVTKVTLGASTTRGRSRSPAEAHLTWARPCARNPPARVPHGSAWRNPGETPCASQHASVDGRFHCLLACGSDGPVRSSGPLGSALSGKRASRHYNARDRPARGRRLLGQRQDGDGIRQRQSAHYHGRHHQRMAAGGQSPDREHRHGGTPGAVGALPASPRERRWPGP